MHVRALSFAVFLGLAAFGSPSDAIAASPGKLISSGPLYSGGSGPSSSTICFLTNLGTKPVTVRSVSMIGNPGAPGSVAFPPENETCTAAPIIPGSGCFFRGGSGVFGGGSARIVGNLKDIRATCNLVNDANVTIQSAPMR